MRPQRGLCRPGLMGRGGTEAAAGWILWLGTYIIFLSQLRESLLQEDPEDTEQCGCWFWLYKILLTEGSGCSEFLLHFHGSPTDAQRVQAGMSRCPGKGGPPTSGLVVLTAAAQGAGQVCQCLGTRQAPHAVHMCVPGRFPQLCVWGGREEAKFPGLLMILSLSLE